MSQEWTIPANGGESKCQWTPYAGRKVCGLVRTVVIRGEEVYVDGEFVGEAGFGKNIRLQPSSSVDLENNKLLENNEILALDNTVKQKERSISQSPIRSLSTITAYNPLYQQNVISVAQFKDKATVNLILDVANRFHNDMGRSFEGLLRVS